MAVKFQMLFIVLRVPGIALPKKGSGAEIDGYLLSSMKATPRMADHQVWLGLDLIFLGRLASLDTIT